MAKFKRTKDHCQTDHPPPPWKTISQKSKRKKRVRDTYLASGHHCRALPQKTPGIQWFRLVVPDRTEVDKACFYFLQKILQPHGPVKAYHQVVILFSAHSDAICIHYEFALSGRILGEDWSSKFCKYRINLKKNVITENEYESYYDNGETIGSVKFDPLLTVPFQTLIQEFIRNEYQKLMPSNVDEAFSITSDEYQTLYI